MKGLAILLACLFIAPVVLHAQPSTSHVFDMEAAIAEKTANRSGNQPFAGNFVGGEDIPNAFAIGSLPFTDSGNTCGFLDDYDEVCPYTGSISPDVVYQFTPGSNMTVEIDMCTSLYDTKVYVYENIHTPGAPFACNDDAGCGITGFQSNIDFVDLTAGNTYYIVVDGWNGDCGDYTLSISQVPPPPPCGACPTAAQVEGEPVCGEGYVDVYNGGCNTAGFTEVTCNTICGESGTYTAAALELRDTDWYTITLGLGETLTYSGIPEGFDLQLLITDAACPTPGILRSTSTSSCVQSPEISITGPGIFYLWAGPLFFNGVSCGSKYTLFIDAPGLPECGFTGACCKPTGEPCDTMSAEACFAESGQYLGHGTVCGSPDPCTIHVERETWSRVKKIYRDTAQ